MTSTGITILYRRGFGGAQSRESTKDMQSIFKEIGQKPVAAVSDVENRRKRIVIPVEVI